MPDVDCVSFLQWPLPRLGLRLRRMIGQRTSEALRVKIADGWTSPSWEARLPQPVRRRIVKMAAAGISQRAIVDRLNAGGVPALGGSWHRGTVIRVLRQAA
jgi:Recombinase